MIESSEYIFEFNGDLWQRINYPAGSPATTLADFLSELDIVVDDDCQFCRIVRYSGKSKTTIEYRAYNSMRVVINIYNTKIL